MAAGFNIENLWETPAGEIFARKGTGYRLRCVKRHLAKAQNSACRLENLFSRRANF